MNKNYLAKYESEENFIPSIVYDNGVNVCIGTSIPINGVRLLIKDNSSYESTILGIQENNKISNILGAVSFFDGAGDPRSFLSYNKKNNTIGLGIGNALGVNSKKHLLSVGLTKITHEIKTYLKLVSTTDTEDTVLLLKEDGEVVKRDINPLVWSASGMGGYTGAQGNTGIQGDTGIQGETGMYSFTGLDAASVTYDDVYYDMFNNVQNALTFLLGPGLDIIAFTNNRNYLNKGQTVQTVNAYYGLTGSILGVNLQDFEGVPGDAAHVGYSGMYEYDYSPSSIGPTGIYSYDLEVTDGVNSDSATTNVYFGLKKYWGQSASSAPDEGIIESALNGGSTLSRDTSSSKSKSTFNQTGGGNYLYYSYPESWGLLSNLVVNGFGSTWNRTTVSITNSYSVTENYYCYTSPNTINGTVSLAFS